MTRCPKCAGCLFWNFETGYKLYYLWGMAGAERKLALHEDPVHSWISKA